MSQVLDANPPRNTAGGNEALWENVTGGIVAFMEAADSKNVRTDLLAGGRGGDPFMELEARGR